MYELDYETLVPISAHTYYFDIKEPEKGFQHLYELKEYYKILDLSPSSIYSLGEKFSKDADFALEVSNLMYRRLDKEVFPSVDKT